MNSLNRTGLLSAVLVIAFLLNGCAPGRSTAIERETDSPAAPESAGGAPDAASRLLSPESAGLQIRAYLHDENPKQDPNLVLAVEELTSEEIWNRLYVQVFRITAGPFTGQSFLIHTEGVIPLGPASGSRNLTALRVADLDQDQTAELLFTYQLVKDARQSWIGMYAPAYDPGRVFYAETGYLGNLGLTQESPAQVSVRVVEPEPETKRIKYLEALGNLAIEAQEGQETRLVLRVNPDLAAETAGNLIPVE